MQFCARGSLLSVGVSARWERAVWRVSVCANERVLTPSHAHTPALVSSVALSLSLASICHRHNSAAHDRITLGAALAYAHPSYLLKCLRLLAAVALLFRLPPSRSHTAPLLLLLLPLSVLLSLCVRTRAQGQNHYTAATAHRNVSTTAPHDTAYSTHRSPFFPIPSLPLSLSFLHEGSGTHTQRTKRSDLGARYTHTHTHTETLSWSVSLPILLPPECRIPPSPPPLPPTYARGALVPPLLPSTLCMRARATMEEGWV